MHGRLVIRRTLFVGANVNRPYNWSHTLKQLSVLRDMRSRMFVSGSRVPLNDQIDAENNELLPGNAAWIHAASETMVSSSDEIDRKQT